MVLTQYSLSKLYESVIIHQLFFFLQVEYHFLSPGKYKIITKSEQRRIEAFSIQS